MRDEEGDHLEGLGGHGAGRVRAPDGDAVELAQREVQQGAGGVACVVVLHDVDVEGSSRDAVVGQEFCIGVDADLAHFDGGVTEGIRLGEFLIVFGGGGGEVWMADGEGEQAVANVSGEKDAVFGLGVSCDEQEEALPLLLVERRGVEGE